MAGERTGCRTGPLPTGTEPRGPGASAGLSRGRHCSLRRGIKASERSRTAGPASGLATTRSAGGPGKVRSNWWHQAAGLSSLAASLPAALQSGSHGAAPPHPVRPGRPARLPSRCADSSTLSFRAALAPSRRDRTGRNSESAGFLHPTSRRARNQLPECGTEGSASRIAACMAREHRRPPIASRPAAVPRRSDRYIDSRTLPTEPLLETGSLTAALVPDLRGRQSVP